MRKKKLAVFCILIVCSTFLFSCGKSGENTENTVDTESIEDTKSIEDAKNIEDTENKDDAEYWLCGTGIPDGPDYTGGICEVYFRQNSIVLEGSLLKSMSQEDYGEQVGTIETYDGEEIEVSADCKVIQDEGNEERAYSYKEYIETREISETDNVAGIYMAITIKNGKVIEIYYSA